MLVNNLKIHRLHGNLMSHLFLSVCLQPVGFRPQRGKSREMADSELLHTTQHWVIGGARRTEHVVPRSQLVWGGASASTPATCLPSAFPLPSQLLGKMEIPANLCLFSHFTNIPSLDCVWPRKQHFTGILKWLLVAVSFWGCFYKCANKFHMSSFVLLSLGL